MQQKIALTEMSKHEKNGVHAPQQQSKESDTMEDPPLLLKMSGYLLRTLLLDLPLILIFVLLVSTYLFHIMMHEYFVPQIDLLKWDKPRDYTYYHRSCNENDISAKDTSDLIVTDAQNAVEKTMTHGAAVFPEILSDSTAQELRNYIMEQNKIREDFDFVIQPKARHSYGMTPNEHPSVSKAINEILSNDFFRSSIEAIAGKDPAIVECTQITA